MLLPQYDQNKFIHTDIHQTPKIKTDEEQEEEDHICPLRRKRKKRRASSLVLIIDIFSSVFSLNMVEGQVQ